MNMLHKSLSSFLLLLALSLAGQAQILKPGFEKREYKELMLVSVRSVADSGYSAKYQEPERFKMLYQSKAIGLDNSWDLWKDERGVGCISIRGTTMEQISWMANFYAAMVPANGELQLRKNDTFRYHLADNQQATVHVGWLICMAALSEEIIPQVDSMYSAGTKDFLIMGHSQGGAIAYLLTAHLLHLQSIGRLANDIQFKTYCSAAPKPGNLYFAYDYEQKTQSGWSYNVVNPADWVPETPPSVQTLNDFNPTNPFKDVEDVFEKQKLPVRIVMKSIYSKLEKPSKNAQLNNQKYLGDMVEGIIRKALPELVVPEYAGTSNFVRTGNFIVLEPNEAYFAKYPKESNHVFTHHVHEPYLLLLENFPD